MRLFQCGLHLVRVGKIFLAHRCRRNVHHVAPTLLIFNGATEWMTSQCHQTESPASSFGMLVNASINSGCHCSDTGNTLPGATPHSSSSGTSSSSGRNSTYAIASGMGTTQQPLTVQHIRERCPAPRMSETRNIWWCCPPCTLQLPYDVPHAVDHIAPDCH